MNARLSSLLVAGGAVLAGIPVFGALDPASTGSESAARNAALVAASLDTRDAIGASIRLQIPNYGLKPRLQVLGSPLRVVVDLPGVNKAMKFGRKDAESLAHPLVRTARIAQFSVAPEQVTRVVLEVVPGTQVDVSQSPEGVLLTLMAGNGQVHARLAPGPEKPIVPAARPIEVERVTAEAVRPSALFPAPEGGPELPAALLPGSPVASPAPLVASSLPAVGSVYRPLPGLAGHALLPLALGDARPQETQAPAESKSQGNALAARTLGDNAPRYTGSRLSIDVHSASVMTFLMILADHAKLNLVADTEVETLTGSFKFTDTPWDLILDMVLKQHGLGKEISHGVIRVAKVEKLQKEEEDRKKLEEAKSLAGDLQGITRSLSYAKAMDVKAVVEKVLTKRGTIIIDERTNTLIISDLPKNISMIDELIAQLDIPIQQVMIEARVVEATKGYEKAFGVKWPTSNSGDSKLSIGGQDATWGAVNSPSWNSINNRPGAGQNNSIVSFSPGKDGVTSIPSPAGEFWVSFLSNRVSINTIIQALESEGTIKIVSTPKLVTQNNKKGKILAGERIPYPALQSGAAGGAITVQFAQANLELDVTPQITNDGTILMDLQIDKAEADFTRQVQGTPTIVQKSIQTQVLVKDGGTAVLGGVYTTNTQAGTKGVPFLSKLPLLGWLFRTKNDKEDSKELLVFITPRIIKN
ncbi:MAG: type IV pilus secretin PilQ [Acidobacteria bacterium]|nr:type IV pilus secretin PilQ [Acidobacteriota bacterium]